MRDQLIPVIVIFLFMLINLWKKKKIICVSNFVFIYLFCSFSGAVLVHLNPRTGYPFSDHEAMIFLSEAYALLMLPLFVMKDQHEDSALLISEFRTLDRNRLFLYLFVAAILLSVLCFLPNILKFSGFLTSGEDRESYRMTLDRSIRGHLFRSMASVFMLFSKLSLFLFVIYFVFDREKTRRVLFLLLGLGALALPLWAMEQIDRREIGKFFIFALCCLTAFLYCTDRVKRRKILINGTLGALILFIPFLIISIARFDDWLYQLLQYFAIGPYFFNADYVANTQYDLPQFLGEYNFTFLTKILHPMLDIRPDSPVDEMWSSPIVYQRIYYQISMCHPFEFKTMVGCFLLDFPATTVLWICGGISLVSCCYFRMARYSLSYVFFCCIYGYMMVFGTLMFAFSFLIFNLELIAIIISGFILSRLIRKRQVSTDEQEESHE